LGRLCHDAGWLHPNKTEKRRTRPKNKELKKKGMKTRERIKRAKGEEE
jgi:hypothetical protein